MTNVLLLWTDEQRFDAMPGMMGQAMPHLAALQSVSTTFERAYCCHPVCTPSRGSILTGLYPPAHGATKNNKPLASDARCLPELLPQFSVTGYNGKWHLGDEIFAQHGFDEWVGIDDAYNKFYSDRRDPNTRSTYHHWLVRQGYQPDKEGGTFSRMFTCRLPEMHGKPAFQAGEAIDFIHRHQENPWLLSVNMLEPHMPFFGPHDDEIDAATLPLPDNFDHRPSDNCLARHRMIAHKYAVSGANGFHLQDETSWRRVRANYAALCELIDRHFGRIIDSLKATGQFDDTLIIFTSDHGDMMGSHGMLAKTTMYEESTRIPFLLKLPNQTAPSVVSSAVSQIDIVPTICDALGAAVPDHLHGQSLLPVLEQSQSSRDVLIQWSQNPNQDGGFLDGDVVQPIYQQLGDPQQLYQAWVADVRTVITSDNWRYTRTSVGECELFDLNADPGEKVNLADDPACQVYREACHGRLLAAMGDVDDPKIDAFAALSSAR